LNSCHTDTAVPEGDRYEKASHFLTYRFGRRGRGRGRDGRGGGEESGGGGEQEKRKGVPPLDGPYVEKIKMRRQFGTTDKIRNFVELLCSVDENINF
jgi:hypothetical protein